MQRIRILFVAFLLILSLLLSACNAVLSDQIAVDDGKDDVSEANNEEKTADISQEENPSSQEDIGNNSGKNPSEEPKEDHKEDPEEDPQEDPRENPGENPGEDPDTPKTLSPLTVTMIDVGQGDCFLIQAPSGTVLIDAGDKSSSSNNKIKKLLDSKEITKIDYLVMTHPDADHIGGIPMILANYTVVNVLMTNATKTTQIYKNVMSDLEKHTEIQVIRAKAGISFELGDAKFRLFSPNSEKYSDSNSYSITIRLDYGQSSFLFCGDISEKSEKEITTKFTAEDLDVDVIKVSHHGADDCTTATLLNMATPTYAMISVGAHNSYGHPGSQLLDRLSKIGATVYRTDLNGNVYFVSDGLQLTVTADK